MMDAESLTFHEDRMVVEPEPFEHQLKFLTEQEVQLFLDLKEGKYLNSRLEQERLSPDYIQDKLNDWVQENLYK